MKSLATSLAFLAFFAASAPGAVIISQYVETDSGTTPKGIELWNTGSATIDFSAANLVVSQGTNGGSPTERVTLTSGSINPNEVIVIGTQDIGDYLDDTFGDGSLGSSSVQFKYYGFQFNGNDSLTVQIGGVTNDVFGKPGNDPGTAWTGNGVSTQNQNIALNSGITTGDLDGWTDPSIRFSTVSTTPSSSGGLSGFGIAPVPEPATLPVWLLCLLPALHRRRTR